MKPKNLTECVELARRKEPFTFNNVYAMSRLANLSESYPPTYSLYSYGLHYPMYVYDYEACQWYGNKTKSTQTTMRHMKMFEPYSIAQWVEAETLSNIAMYGIVHTSAQRME